MPTIKFFKVVEAAKILGRSPQGLRSRADRDTIPHRHDNHGVLEIGISDQDIKEAAQRLAPEEFPKSSNVAATSSNDILELKNEQIADLKADKAKLELNESKLFGMLESMQEERREMMALFTKAESKILELKAAKDVADDRSRKAIEIIKDNASKLK